MTIEAPISPQHAVSAAPWRRYAARFDVRTGLIILILIPIEIVMARSVHLTGTMQCLRIWPSVAILLCTAWYCRWRPLPKLIDVSELALWAILLMDVLALLIQIAGRSPYPLADRQLGAIDARMHFQTAAIVHLVDRLPALAIALNISYNLTALLILGAIVVPPIVGRTVASRRFVTGVILAAILTAILFAFVPAAGPWMIQPIRPTREQAEITGYLNLLKSSGPVRLNPDLAAIVSFPSFHTVLAILSAAALGSVRWVRIPAWIVAALICISTITTGWHYGVDVLAGLVLSVITLWLARRIESDTGNLL